MSRATGHPSYSMPSRLTPIHAVCSGREYQAFHCTPSTPSWTPIQPIEPLPNDLLPKVVEGSDANSHGRQARTVSTRQVLRKALPCP